MPAQKDTTNYAQPARGDPAFSDAEMLIPVAGIHRTEFRQNRAAPPQLSDPRLRPVYAAAPHGAWNVHTLLTDGAVPAIPAFGERSCLT